MRVRLLAALVVVVHLTDGSVSQLLISQTSQMFYLQWPEAVGSLHLLLVCIGVIESSN